ncbi:MAG: transcription-repair coupling factor, partial [Pseudomonadota bacterium]
KRIAGLSELLSWQKDDKYFPRIFLTTVNAALQRVTPQSVLSDKSFEAKTGGALDEKKFQDFLIQNGYIRTETVREAGEYALRGGIIDLFPSDRDDPIRIDLFGDEIESIKTFDSDTQRTLENIQRFSLKPVSEFFFDDESISRFRQNYRETFGAVRSEDPLYNAIKEGRKYNGMDHWLPFFFDEALSSIFDIIDNKEIFMDANVLHAAQERVNQTQDFFQARLTLQQAALKKKKDEQSVTNVIYNPLPPELLYLNDDVFFESVKDAHQFSSFKPANDTALDGEGRKGRDFADARAEKNGDVIGVVQDYIQSQQSQEKKALIAAYSEGARERLKVMLKETGFKRLKNCHNREDLMKVKKDEVGLAILSLEYGFVANDLAVVTEQDILGDRLSRKIKKRKKADNFLTEVSSLDVGDLVVHIDHGIGRFEGLETLEALGTPHDCLKVIYDGDDKLFVPVENIDVLSRFGSDEGTTPLDRLGGANWQARKARVKKDLMKMADQLMKIAAARILKNGEKLSIEKEPYEQFVAKFPYQETEDQLRSINDVVRDLNGDHPMDRLVCGDVGFGKTEVALRAAYVAAMAGAQVALVVPTTLLARQHYAGFLERFAGTGLKIGQLSRLASSKEIKETKEGLAKGDVNIVIGTHAVFAKDVSFAHLGLVIVDEEQRFGVKQKEKLKELRNDVHMLTLTATPIPRTLQMSLTGVKEMSLITTPPVDRLAIRTFVLPFDPLVIREALMREHYRGGQSFYVCPRIKDLKEVKETLNELVPELKTVSAHGQMTPTELDEKMTAFYDGQYDVLLATNIIESGIDIPTANTMIVHRADMFGLAQLYQIRGRIGRSKVRAYAYLTHDPKKKLTPQGQKRLEVIETLDTLGAGFQLASHDMDIRGAGNLLGEEQSGHIKEIGVELYQQLLEEAVAMAKAGVDMDADDLVEGTWSPQINIGTSVLIPENYVADLSVRMSLYRRLADLEGSEAIDAFAAELIDRFGDLPEEVENLLDIMTIKQLCRKAGVDRVDAGPKGVVFGFYKDTPPNPQKIMKWVDEKKGSVKIRPKDQKIVATRKWDTPAERVKGVRSLMTELARL